MKELRTQCAIAGGGPAGMMLAYLLARAGVAVIVCEKHADFLRDFRGDTVHPSTLEIMHELGLAERLLQLPHQKIERLSGAVGNQTFPFADFSHLPVHYPFIALMPQWDFLNFLASEAKAFANFTLLMRTEVIGTIEEAGKITGVRARSPEGETEIKADLVIAADGRHSTVRASGGFIVEDIGAPMDVLWFRLSRQSSDPPQTLGRIDGGSIFVQLNRGDYWQCAYVIPKGSVEDVHRRGLDAFRAEIVRQAPFFADRIAEIVSFEDAKLLTVGIDRLTRWHKPGLICIGDAAHTMSPIGGVGINVAIQDAVAAGNVLAEPLRKGTVTDANLAAVQARRELPVRVVQGIQVFIQKRVISTVLAKRGGEVQAPRFLHLLSIIPILQQIPARVLGLGLRREHVGPAILGR
ncbi:MAG TPA: FAD-dependent oxidoreductase [Beijerinckiaceae bacterium]|jgi:2-polyprenyl-6-methoxyphenol hydroxylase-like FAD-dependent oxidoreductase|nr:FAD-dependent oxidoreductase [Beijerinckiaceae bacterium]